MASRPRRLEVTRRREGAEVKGASGGVRASSMALASRGAEQLAKATALVQRVAWASQVGVAEKAWAWVLMGAWCHGERRDGAGAGKDE